MVYFKCPTWRRVTPFIQSSLLQTTLLLLNVLYMKAVPQGSQRFFCVLYMPNVNISNVAGVVGDGVALFKTGSKNFHYFFLIIYLFATQTLQ